jgi:hypothetical protein
VKEASTLIGERNDPADSKNSLLLLTAEEISMANRARNPTNATSIEKADSIVRSVEGGVLAERGLRIVMIKERAWNGDGALLKSATMMTKNSMLLADHPRRDRRIIPS